jgi:hypothetical protein
LSVKDLTTRRVLARYDGTGPLYTLPLPTLPTTTPRVVPYALATVASFVTWHRRLGHLDPDVLSKLSSTSAITCPQGRDDFLCHAYQLGRHVRLPFPSSSTRALQPFDLIHCDLWTSPVPSVFGYKYYLVILDDCTHYSWIFPLHQKFDTFSTLSHFFAFVYTQFGRTIRSVQCDNGRSLITLHPHFLPLSRRPALDVVSLYFPAERQGRAHDSYHQRCHAFPVVPGFPSNPLLG